VSVLLVILGFVTVWFLRAQQLFWQRPFRVGAQPLAAARPSRPPLELAAVLRMARCAMAWQRCALSLTARGMTSTRRRNLCRSAEQNCALLRREHSVLPAIPMRGCWQDRCWSTAGEGHGFYLAQQWRLRSDRSRIRRWERDDEMTMPTTTTSGHKA